MATKYGREREAPRLLRKDENAASNPRRWALFVALLAVCVLGFLHGPSSRLTFEGQPVLHGEGIIYDKLIDGGIEPNYLLQVGVALDNDHVAFDYVPTDPETWDKLSKGARIGILYQRSRIGNAIRIREPGLVALPAPNQ